MSGTKDTNWRSFVGPQDNNRTVTPLDWTNPIVPSNWDDIFKCSHVDNLTANGLTISGGSREDSVDAVQGSNYRWLFCTILGSVTLKGAIKGWRIEGGTVVGPIVLGQFDKYWYWGRPPTREGEIHAVTTGKGTPLEIWVWDATVPTVTATPVRIRRVPKLVWLPYFCFRYVYIRAVALITRKPI